MTRTFLSRAPGVPAPTSPISHAVVVGDTCWISGQHSLDDEGRYVPGTAGAEARRAFELVFRVAEAAGFSAEELVFVDIAFADLSELPEVNEVFSGFFEEGRRPARTIYQAARLPFGARIKVQAVAAREGLRRDHAYSEEGRDLAGPSTAKGLWSV